MKPSWARRVSLAPPGYAFIGRRHPIDHSRWEGLANELQRQGQAVLGEARGHGERRLSRHVEGLAGLARVEAGAGGSVLDQAGRIHVGGGEPYVDLAEGCERLARE